MWVCTFIQGLETATVLTKEGGHVILACRPGQKADQALQSIKEKVPEGQVELMPLDLGSTASIKKFAAEFKSKGTPLHVLINNAGVMACPYGLTEDGFEMQLGTNHFGHFLLTHLLLDKLKGSGDDCRVVCVSSEAHKLTPKGGIKFDDLKYEQNYSPWYSYGQSKLANVLYASELQRRLKADGVTNVTAYSLHPGGIMTDLQRHTGGAMGYLLWGLDSCGLFKSIPQGAATSVTCATSDKVLPHAGGYFEDCNPVKPSAYGQDAEMAKKLWEVTEKELEPFMK